MVRNQARLDRIKALTSVVPPRKTLRLALPIWLIAALGCGSSLPAPATGAHVEDDFFVVPFPPPPAHSQIVPNQPNKRAVWLNGEWVWRRNRWLWEPGTWLVPPENATFAPWTTQRQKEGLLLFAPGTWHLPDGRRVPTAWLLDRRQGDRRQRDECPTRPQDLPLVPLEAGDSSEPPALVSCPNP